MKKLFVTWAIVMALGVTGLPATAQEEEPERPQGSVLAADVSDQNDVNRVTLESLQHFHQDGGVAAFEPNTPNEEFISYEGFDVATSELTDVSRHEGSAHPSGSFVWSVPGSTSVDAIPASLQGEGARLKVRDVKAFDPNGDTAVLAPGTDSEERLGYAGIDPDTNELVGLTRPGAEEHPTGTIVQDKQWAEYPSEANDPEEVSPSPDSTNEPEGPGTEVPTNGDPTQSPEPDPSASAAPEGEASSPTSGVTDITDGFVGATQPGPEGDDGDGTQGAAPPDIVETVLELIADPPGPNPADVIETVGELVGDTEPPDVCAGILRNFLCPPPDLQDIIELSNSCDDGTGRTCAEMIAQLIGDPDVCNGPLQNLLCPPRTPDVEAIADQVCNDDEWWTQGSEECANMLLYYEEVLRQELCYGQAWTTCLVDKVPEVDPMAIVDEAAGRVCTRSGTSPIQECLNTVLYYDEVLRQELCYGQPWATCLDGRVDGAVAAIIGQVDSIARTLCPQSGASAGCVNEAISLVNNIINAACSDRPAPEEGALECINMVLENIDGLLQQACGSPGSTGTEQCTNSVLGLVNTIARNVCPQSGASTGCVNEVIAQVNNLINAACSDQPPPEEGALECINMVIESLGEELGCDVITQTQWCLPPSPCDQFDPLSCVPPIVSTHQNPCASAPCPGPAWEAFDCLENPEDYRVNCGTTPPEPTCTIDTCLGPEGSVSFRTKQGPGSDGDSRATVTLFVHGYQFDGSAHCPDKFAYGQQRLRDFGQTGVFHTVKFYGNDTGCTKDIHAFGEHNEHFSSPGGGHEDGHTTDTDIRHLAYHLAKMIYHDYSKHGIYVQIISHSMGGLITRYALAQAEAGNPDFPPYLLVQDVATLGTPHAGVKATTYFCRDSQKQCRQMTAGSEFLLWLYQNAQHPDGYPATDWTNMASYEDQLVDEESATAMGADHKVIYWGGEENRPRIGHSGYMEDGPDTRDAHVYWRDAGQSWFAWKEGPHAIRWIDHSIYHYSW